MREEKVLKKLRVMYIQNSFNLDEIDATLKECNGRHTKIKGKLLCTPRVS